MKAGCVLVAVLLILFGFVGSCIRSCSGEQKLRMDETEEYALGFDAGYLVGKTDASEGRERDWKRAEKLAKLNSSGSATKRKRYEFGYSRGYNEGWHQRKAVMSR